MENHVKITAYGALCLVDEKEAKKLSDFLVEM